MSRNGSFNSTPRPSPRPSLSPSPRNHPRPVSFNSYAYNHLWMVPVMFLLTTIIYLQVNMKFILHTPTLSLLQLTCQGDRTSAASNLQWWKYYTIRTDTMTSNVIFNHCCCILSVYAAHRWEGHRTGRQSFWPGETSAMCAAPRWVWLSDTPSLCHDKYDCLACHSHVIEGMTV